MKRYLFHATVWREQIATELVWHRGRNACLMHGAYYWKSKMD
jgi:hypothetical protein